MKKYLLGTLAILLALGFSAFKKYDSFIYLYSGAQTAAARQIATNYTEVTSQTCSGGANECTVTLNVDNGTNPDFSSGKVTFDANGFPNGGTTFVSNAKRSTP